jgi:tetratricopeptide (TPR) repeat protein
VEKGLNTFHEVLKIDSSPASLNSVAYELADANVSLTDALGYAEKAVQKQEEVSKDIELASLESQDLQLTRNIGSYWDTLGWVHFRLGHLDQAEKYIHASWLLLQQPNVADQLGQLYEQQRKKDEAIHMYRLALAASESPTLGFVHTEIQEHLSRLLPGAALSTGMDLHRGPSAREELSQIRTVKMKTIVSGSASAEFFLLFGPGAKLEAVQFVSGSDKLKSADKAIRTLTFPVSYPSGSAAHLVRRAVVACSDFDSGCELVLVNPDDVKSIN